MDSSVQCIVDTGFFQGNKIIEPLFPPLLLSDDKQHKLRTVNLDFGSLPEVNYSVPQKYTVRIRNIDPQPEDYQEIPDYITGKEIFCEYEIDINPSYSMQNLEQDLSNVSVQPSEILKQAQEQQAKQAYVDDWIRREQKPKYIKDLIVGILSQIEGIELVTPEYFNNVRQRNNKEVFKTEPISDYVILYTQKRIRVELPEAFDGIRKHSHCEIYGDRCYLIIEIPNKVYVSISVVKPSKYGKHPAFTNPKFDGKILLKLLVPNYKPPPVMNYTSSPNNVFLENKIHDTLEIQLHSIMEGLVDFPPETKSRVQMLIEVANSNFGSGEYGWVFADGDTSFNFSVMILYDDSWYYTIEIQKVEIFDDNFDGKDIDIHIQMGQILFLYIKNTGIFMEEKGKGKKWVIDIYEKRDFGIDAFTEHILGRDCYKVLKTCSCKLFTNDNVCPVLSNYKLFFKLQRIKK